MSMSEKPGAWGSGQVSGPRTEWRTVMPPATAENQAWNRAAMDAINRREDGWRGVLTHFYEGVLTVWSVVP